MILGNLSLKNLAEVTLSNRQIKLFSLIQTFLSLIQTFLSLIQTFSSLNQTFLSLNQTFF